MGDVAGAMRELKEMAGELADKGRQPEAIDVLREAAKLNADDEEIREKLFDVLHRRRRLRAGARLRDHDRAVPHDRGGASKPQDQADEALATLRQAAARQPARHRAGL